MICGFDVVIYLCDLCFVICLFCLVVVFDECCCGLGIAGVSGSCDVVNLLVRDVVSLGLWDFVCVPLDFVFWLILILIFGSCIYCFLFLDWFCFGYCLDFWYLYW